jgi:hypothetical protein
LRADGDLRERWTHQEKRVEAIVEDLRCGRDWTRNLLGKPAKRSGDLPFLGSCGRPSLATESAPRDLRGLVLRDVDLSGCEGLADSEMDGCIFEGVILQMASLAGSSLKGAVFRGGCVLDDAKFQFADLSGADFRAVSIQRADFTESTIVGTDFRDADLRGCIIAHAKFNEETSFGALVGKRWTRFGGEYQLAGYLSSESDPWILKYISGETSRWLLTKRHPILSRLWYVLANFGKSPARLFLWVAVIWLMFGFLYAGFKLPSCFSGSMIGRVLVWPAPRIIWSNGKERPSQRFEALYFSTVTLTTLGYGDVHPAPGDWKGEFYICIEAMLGYVVLGLFVSLLVQNSS